MNPTILIADDEPLIVSALGRLARREGLSFISDTTSEHVLELARAHQPEVILMDVHQKIDGRDLISRLKKDPATRGLKVIVLTAVDDQFTRRLCLEIGADEYLVKPCDSSFMRRIARVAGEVQKDREAVALEEATAFINN
jgi:CheY-like chemotaxis protein